MSNETRDYGDIIVTLTSAYDQKWNDRKSGATKDGAFWHPQSQSQGSLRPLGSVGIGNYEDINKNLATLLVGPKPGSPGKPAVSSPTDYSEIWNDKGSGIRVDDGSFWRPKAPDGYVSLGDVAQTGYEKPQLDIVWCLRSDLAASGRYPDSNIWDSKKSGAHKYGSMWATMPSDPGVNGSENVPVLAGTFRANEGLSEPDHDIALVPVLNLKNNYQKFDTPVPQIKKDNIPSHGETYDLEEQCTVTLPFISFFPPTDRRSLDNIGKPFCTISRSIAWYVEAVYENNSGGKINRSQTVKAGISKEETQEMTHSVGVEISASAGIKLFQFGVSLNYQFTYSNSITFTEYQEHEVTEEFTVPEYYATVVFAKHIWIKGSRADGSSIMGQIDFNANDDVHLSGTSLT